MYVHLETVRASCVACAKTNKNKKRGNSNKFNNMIKHMRITDRGNEISSDSPPDRDRDTMMLVIMKEIVPGRTLGGLGVGTQRCFEYIRHITSHWAVHQVKNEKSLVPIFFFVYIVHGVFDHKDPQKNVLD